MSSDKYFYFYFYFYFLILILFSSFHLSGRFSSIILNEMGFIQVDGFSPIIGYKIFHPRFSSLIFLLF
jgi:hypothetical protein